MSRSLGGLMARSRTRGFAFRSLVAVLALAACDVEEEPRSVAPGLGPSRTADLDAAEPLTADELVVLDGQSKWLLAISQTLSDGKHISALAEEDQILATAAYEAYVDAVDDPAYAAIAQAIAELEAAGGELGDVDTLIALAPTASTDEFVDQAYSFYFEWRDRLSPGSAGDADSARAAPPNPAVVIRVISLVLSAGKLVAKIVEMSGRENETMVEVPRWVCSKQVWDKTIVGWSRKWYQLGIHPVYRGWVCTEVQCLVTHVPESLVPNIPQCNPVGARQPV